MWWFKRKIDNKSQFILSILFPEMDVDIDNNGDIFHLDYSADSCLEAALQDLQGGINDAATQKNIRDIADRLFQIRKRFNVRHKFDSNAKYVIVSSDSEYGEHKYDDILSLEEKDL